ncbi:AMP-dependent synthetase and ligase domain protein [Mycobacterium xenopi 3993]|nr:AMP-dependent synthetase and ligase domain protein [Mycobacterium xenopi 3993]
MDCPMNLFTLLEQAAHRFPERGAVYHGERLFCTWGELRERSLRLAGSIRQRCPAAARIGIASENRRKSLNCCSLFGGRMRSGPD